MLVHLDTDIGGDTDDLCALAMLLGLPGVEVAAISTVGAEGALRGGMVAYALGLAGRRGVPVAAGAESPLSPAGLDGGLTDPERLWPAPIEPVRSAPGAALDLLAASIERGATVVGIGPWTNLALLEVARPGTLARARLVLMGGSFDTLPWGGVSAGRWLYDYNVNQDREAARIVLGAADATIVPLPTTLRAPLREAHVDRLRGGGPLARLVVRQSVAYAELNENRALGRAHDGLPDDLLNFQHDPLAVAVACGWDGATIERVPVALRDDDRGLRLTAAADGKPMRVATAVDGEAFAARFVEAVLRT